MGVRRGFRSASAAAVAAALFAGACGGDGSDVTAKLGPVAAVPDKKRVDFGDVPAGESSSKTVTVTNSNDTPQKITGLDVDSTSSDVTISGGTCHVGEALEPDETCTVVMTLRPPARGGSDSAVLTIDRTSTTTNTDNTDDTDKTDNTDNTDDTGTGTTDTGTGNTDTTGTGTATTESETTPDTGTTPTTATPGG